MLYSSPQTCLYRSCNGPQYAPRIAVRCISSTPVLYKKGGKANMSHTRTDSSPPVTDASRRTPTDEAFDFSTLESGILKALEKLTRDLSQLRSGGRFNPDVVENLKVQLGKAGSKETVRLKDLAQVVPKGRLLNVIVGEKEVSFQTLGQRCYFHDPLYL